VHSGPRPPLAAALLLASCTAACQLVFGIDDFQADGAGEGAAGSSGVGGDPGNGGSGGDPSCVCEADVIWRAVNLASRGPGDMRLPTQCGNGSSPTNLFIGPPAVTCTACTCDAKGCEEPPLHCFQQPSCDGAHTVLTPGSVCEPNSGCRSVLAAGTTSAAACDPRGGEVLDDAPSFAEYLSFCGELSCADGCLSDEAECVVAEGIPAVDCPAGFEQRYVVASGGSPSCEPCTCSSPSCAGSTFVTSPLLNCGLPSFIGDNECFTDPNASIYSSRSDKTPAACAANHDAQYAGTFEVSGEQTVCCRAALDDVPPG